MSEDCEVWSHNDDDNVEIEDLVLPTESDEHNEPPSIVEESSTTDSQSYSLIVWLTTFIIHLQAHFRLSDRVVCAILAFFGVFFKVLGRLAPGSILFHLARNFPCTLHQLNTHYLMKTKQFQRYVVCRKCHRTYFFHHCIEKRGRLQLSKQCSYKPFPNHPHSSRRGCCNTLLLKTVELSSGKSILYPFLSYCYLGLQTSLQSLLQRSGFAQVCDKWRSTQRVEGVYQDLYDGQIWKDFYVYGGQPFLTSPLTFGFALNVDWFQPYKHVNYSVGVIFLSVMNLPRSVRFKRENVLLVGIIPGPDEPSCDINTYLEPLVEELLQFWSGVEMEVSHEGRKLIRCALLCIACDLPAGRKVCGFLSHAAQLGCSKCKKRFTGTVGAMNYSGFNREKWLARTGQSHRESAECLLCCRTKTERATAESMLGVRYTVLLKLPYFDGPRMLVVDPMHNLFLGTAKHFLKAVWIDLGIIDSKQFSVIQSRVDKAVVPSDIGRIPHKIDSGFSSFTADQFKNWVVYFSIIALRDILLPNDLECWRHFVLACRVLCSRQLTRIQISLADSLLLQFCRRSQRMYGENIITPNMHMHCHLRDCILDFGPLQGFWLFTYERFNGILGDLPNNNRSIEYQLMNRYVRDSQFLTYSPDTDFREEFIPVLPGSDHCIGSLSVTSIMPHSPISPESVFAHWGVCHHKVASLPNNFSKGLFQSSELQCLKKLYSDLYSVPLSSLDVPSIFEKFSTITLNGKQLGSYKSRSSSSSLVLSLWNQKLFYPTVEHTGDNECVHRPTRINFFAKHNIEVNGIRHSLILFSASWFKYHPDKDIFGKPITVWECDIYETPGSHSIIPVEFIEFRTVSLVDQLSNISGHVLLVCPCIDF